MKSKNKKIKKKIKSMKIKSRKVKIINRIYGGMQSMMAMAKSAGDKAGINSSGFNPSKMMDNAKGAIGDQAAGLVEGLDSGGPSGRGLAGSEAAKAAAAIRSFDKNGFGAGVADSLDRVAAEGLGDMNNLKKMKPSGGVIAILKDIAKTLAGVSGAILSIPVRNIDELIPPQFCKKLVKNNMVCSQSMIDYVFRGTKPDHRKILLDTETAKKQCIRYDDEGNKLVQCKKGGSTYKRKTNKTNNKKNTTAKHINKLFINRLIFKSYSDPNYIKSKYTGTKFTGTKFTGTKFTGGSDKEIDGYNGMIIECKKVGRPKYKVNDRVMVKSTKELNGELKGKYTLLNDEKWFIGTIKSMKGDTKLEIVIQIDKGDRVTTDSEEFISEYDQDAIDFFNQIYAIYPEPKTRFQRGCSFFKLPSEIILRTLIKLQTNPEAIVSDLKRNANDFKDNVLIKIKSYNDGLAKNALRLYNSFNRSQKALFQGLDMIGHRIINGGDSIEKIFREIKANEAIFAEAMNKKLEVILDRLIKVNLYLRKYECPRKKLEFLINNINDKVLLQNILKICNRLMTDTNYDSNLDNRARGLECDNKYNENKSVGMKNLEINPDAVYLPKDFFETVDIYTLLNPEKAALTNCTSCKRYPWATLLGKYGCLASSALMGSRTNMNYIIVNILLDMTASQSAIDSNDDIRKNITDILKNIECRSDLRSIIEQRIKYLEKP